MQLAVVLLLIGRAKNGEDDEDNDDEEEADGKGPKEGKDRSKLPIDGVVGCWGGKELAGADRVEIMERTEQGELLFVVRRCIGVLDRSLSAEHEEFLLFSEVGVVVRDVRVSLLSRRT